MNFLQRSVGLAWLVLIRHKWLHFKWYSQKLTVAHNTVGREMGVRGEHERLVVVAENMKSNKCKVWNYFRSGAGVDAGLNDMKTTRRAEYKQRQRQRHNAPPFAPFLQNRTPQEYVILCLIRCGGAKHKLILHNPFADVCAGGVRAYTCAWACVCVCAPLRRPLRCLRGIPLALLHIWLTVRFRWGAFYGKQRVQDTRHTCLAW